MTRLSSTCQLVEITPIFRGRSFISTTRMTCLALGTCSSCSRTHWIETEYDASTTSWSELPTSSCTWNLTELLSIERTPINYRVNTSNGWKHMNLVSTRL